MSERFTTPVGRLVQGDCFRPQLNDQSGRPRVVKQGPNTGQSNPQYFIGLAIPKTPGVTDWKLEQHPFFQTVARVGVAEFPGGQHAWPQFAWKIVDGDSPAPNQAGRAWNTIEGFAGHWVARFASSYPPKCFARPNYAPADQLNDPTRIVRGYWLTVNGSCSGNGNTTGNPGVYLNLDMISLEGFGDPIISGPDASEVFGGAVPALPAGASVAPVVPQAAVVAPVAAPAPYSGFMQAPAPVAPAPAPVAPAPAPAYVPAPAPAYVPAPAPAYVPGPVMLPAANGLTREQYLAVGWTDAMLIEKGMMAA